MPVELSDLLSDECWVDVELRGFAIRVAYRPNATGLIRQAQIAKLMRELEEQGGMDETEIAQHTAKIFCEVVCDWDLTQQGKPLPVTPDVVGRLPLRMVNAITRAITLDGNDEGEKKELLTTSATGSSAKERRANVRSGTRTSAPPGSWA